MRVLIGLLAVLGFAACAEALPSGSSVRPLWIDKRQGCTATSINEKIGLWLTAQHCTTSSNLEIEDHSNPDVPMHSATIVWSSIPDDMAVLFTATLRVTALSLAETGPGLGETVQYIGYPLSLKTPQYFRGYLSAQDTHITGDEGTVDYGRHDIFGMGVCQGASGSAIVNEAGQIVSVVQLSPGGPCSPVTGGARFARLRQFVARFFKE